jgi:hypothetical protein
MNITRKIRTLLRGSSPIDMFKKAISIFRWIGFFLGAIGAYMAISSTWLVVGGQSVKGIVIELKTSVSSSSSSSSRGRYRSVTTTTPVIAYEFNGKSYTYEGSADEDSEFDRNQEVDMLVNPSFPGHAKINSYDDLWSAAVGLGLFGGFLIGFSSVIQRGVNQFKHMFNPDAFGKGFPPVNSTK